MRIGIIGNGVVGNATAEAFRPAHEVRCYDRVPERSPYTLAEVLACDLVFVCLPTPQMGHYLRCDTDWVEGFLSGIGHKDTNFVLRSTVPIGFTRKMRERYGLTNLVHSPEFLTARTAVEDAKNPTRLVIGYPNEYDTSGRLDRKPSNKFADAVYFFYRSTWPDIVPFEVSSDESEMLKLMQNSFSAVKIAFFNEARALADRHSLNWNSMMQALLAGGWINPMHTQVPGPDGKRGFGGTCLPKDLANWITCLRDAGLEDNVSFAAHTRNQKDRQ